MPAEELADKLLNRTLASWLASGKVEQAESGLSNNSYLEHNLMRGYTDSLSSSLGRLLLLDARNAARKGPLGAMNESAQGRAAWPPIQTLGDSWVPTSGVNLGKSGKGHLQAPVENFSADNEQQRRPAVGSSGNNSAASGDFGLRTGAPPGGAEWSSRNASEKKAVGPSVGEDKGAPLNNLAMALNVMNMVLLNQKLANHSSGPPASATAPERPHQQQSAAATTMPNNNPQALAANESLTGAQQSTSGRQGAKRRLKASQVVVIDPGRQLAGGKGLQVVLQTTGAKRRAPVAQTAGRPGGRPRGEQNHRTSSNSIKLHSSLLQANASEPSQRPNSTADAGQALKYHYQPLVVAGDSTNSSSPSSGAQNASAPAKQAPSSSSSAAAAAAPNEESESDHAARWNDVLQHLSLA